MKNNKITKERLLPYIEKWRSITLSTQRINQIKAEAIINRTYKLLKLENPTILFFSSPIKATSWFIDNSDRYYLENYYCLKQQLRKMLYRECDRDLYSYRLELDDIAYEEQCLFADACDIIYDPIYQAYDNTGNWWYKVTYGELLYNNCCVEDFLISELKINCNLSIWKLWQSLVKECLYIFAFADVCLIIDRPYKIHLDNNYKIHQDGYPAIVYEDGYQIYAYRGIRIPEKYGKIPTKQWQPQWILSEKDEEVRPALKLGIEAS